MPASSRRLPRWPLTPPPGGGYANNTTALGTGALTSEGSSPAFGNTALGTDALFVNTTGTSNIAVGSLALDLNNGNYNVGVGTNSLQYNSSGDANVGVGYEAILNASTGSNNVAVGVQALYEAGASAENVAVGESALANATNVVGATALGALALQNSVSTLENTAVGYYSSLERPARPDISMCRSVPIRFRTCRADPSTPRSGNLISLAQPREATTAPAEV
jgi:hypothetical protein